MRGVCQNCLMTLLSTRNHDRDVAGLTYVYPVVSRRSGGVSLGVNLNPNNACNWGCIYCQVPNLQRGGPPAIDLARLEAELRQMLDAILHGDFLADQVPEGMRRLSDIALSGNGEPTSAPEFPAVVALIAQVLNELNPAGGIRLRLITNGSLLGRAYVRDGLRAMALCAGEVWFKFDRATRAGLRLVNATECDPEPHYQRLKIASSLCPTWMQTCMFALDGAAPSAAEVDAWLELIARAVREAVPLQGVLLYGLARPSLQAQEARLGALSDDWLRDLARRVETLGLAVRVSP